MTRNALQDHRAPQQASGPVGGRRNGRLTGAAADSYAKDSHRRRFRGSRRRRRAAQSSRGFRRARVSATRQCDPRARWTSSSPSRANRSWRRRKLERHAGGVVHASLPSLLAAGAARGGRARLAGLWRRSGRAALFGRRADHARQCRRSLNAAWTFSTGDIGEQGRRRCATPPSRTRRSWPTDDCIVCSPFNEVSALDPGTGKQIWRFDPKIDPDLHYPNSFVCRGVAYWRRSESQERCCASRIFLATNDRRLIALDAATGKPCAGISATQARSSICRVPGAMIYPGEVQNTSAPVVTPWHRHRRFLHRRQPARRCAARHGARVSTR